ncbi:MAG: hypothetical protein FWG14_10355 [Peptococcaceae bacterium]|nr:hypothetical protein [Peptococcaceae bacterium]
MILNISHIAFSCTLKEQAGVIRRFEKEGYMCKFVTEKIPVLEQKRRFMTFPESEHDMAFLEKPGAISIEVNAYSHTSGASSLQLNTLSIIMPTADVQISASLFKALGCEITSAEHDQAILVINYPMMKQPVHMILKKDPDRHHQGLDPAGFCGLCFLSNSVHKEQERLLHQGIQCSEPASQIINNVALDICFITSPSGDIIEIISPSHSGKQL